MIQIQEKILKRQGRHIRKVWLVIQENKSSSVERKELSFRKIDISSLPPSTIRELKQVMCSLSSPPPSKDAWSIGPSIGVSLLVHALIQRRNPFRHVPFASQEEIDAILWLFYKAIFQRHQIGHVIQEDPEFQFHQVLGLSIPSLEVLRKACGILHEHYRQVLQCFRGSRESFSNHRRRSREKEYHRLYLYDVDSIYFDGNEKTLMKEGFLLHVGSTPPAITSILTDETGTLRHTDLSWLTEDAIEKSVHRIEETRKQHNAKFVICVNNLKWYEYLCSRLPNQAYHYGFVQQLPFKKIVELMEQNNLSPDTFTEEWEQIKINDSHYLIRSSKDKIQRSAQLYRDKFQELKEIIESYISKEENQNQDPVEIVRLFKEQADKIGIGHLVRFIRRNEKLRPVLDRERLHKETILHGIEMIEVKIATSRWSKREILERIMDIDHIQQAFYHTKQTLRALHTMLSHLGLEERFSRVSFTLAVVAYDLFYYLARTWQRLHVSVEEGFHRLRRYSILQREAEEDSSLLPKFTSREEELFHAVHLPIPSLDLKKISPTTSSHLEAEGLIKIEEPMNYDHDESEFSNQEGDDTNG